MQASRIVQNLKPVYLLVSSEPLLLRDWLDEARGALRNAGFEDIVNLQTDSGFDWNELLQDGDTMSLFSAQKCRIITLSTGKPGQQGSKAIKAICDDPAEGSVYIFVAPVADRQMKSSSWYKSIAGVGDVVEIKPVYDNQLADWIAERARQKGFSIDPQSAQFLAERTEGNLLAADQELVKLSIRFGDQSNIDFETIESSVGESARYSHFVLVDACLSGNGKRALRVLRSLETEGYVTPQLRWALQNSLELLNLLKQKQTAGSMSERTWQELRIWRNQQRLYQSAMRRMSASQVERLLQSCATLDRLGKGQQDSDFPGQDWQQIESMVAGFSGNYGIKDESGFTKRN